MFGKISQKPQAECPHEPHLSTYTDLLFFNLFSRSGAPVEEEYQIIHPQTRQLRSRAQAILAKAQPTLGDQVSQEMYLSQIEVGTSICQTLSQVRAELQVLRGQLIVAAQKSDSRLVAAGTYPFFHWQDQQLTPNQRYIGLETDFQ